MIKYDEFCVHCLKVCDLPRHPDEEARSRCVRIIEILISAKANINPRNSKGSTPLMWPVCSTQKVCDSVATEGLCLHVNPHYLAAPSSWSFDWNGFERDSLLPFVTIAYRHVPLSWNNENDQTASCVAKVRMSSEEHWGGEAVSWHPKDLTFDGISGDQLPPDPEADQRGLQIFKLKDAERFFVLLSEPAHFQNLSDNPAIRCWSHHTLWLWLRIWESTGTYCIILPTCPLLSNIFQCFSYMSGLVP